MSFSLAVVCKLAMVCQLGYLLPIWCVIRRHQLAINPVL
uniref:Uncharacterized protein n=1 Tax=Arundo donax TaxID=35708 RepID=A0A0A9G7L4_ARUDO